MSKQSGDDLLTDREAAKYLRLSLTDFRDLVLLRSPFSSEFAAYEQLPPERRPKAEEGSRPGYVPMYNKAELEAYKQKQESPAKKKGGKK